MEAGHLFDAKGRTEGRGAAVLRVVTGRVADTAIGDSSRCEVRSSGALHPGGPLAFRACDLPVQLRHLRRQYVVSPVVRPRQPEAGRLSMAVLLLTERGTLSIHRDPRSVLLDYQS